MNPNIRRFQKKVATKLASEDMFKVLLRLLLSSMLSNMLENILSVPKIRKNMDAGEALLHAVLLCGMKYRKKYDEISKFNFGTFKRKKFEETLGIGGFVKNYKR